MKNYYLRSLEIVDGIVNDISPYSRNSSVTNLEKLKNNNAQMIEITKQLRTMSFEDREYWERIYRTQAKLHKTNIRKIIYEFYSRMTDLIECENELIRIFGIDYENNPEYLELEM